MYIFCFRVLVLGHAQCVRDVFTDICIYSVSGNGIGSYSVCKRGVHRFLYIFCFRILVLGHTQCVREIFTDFCIYCVSGYWYWVILSV